MWVRGKGGGGGGWARKNHFCANFFSWSIFGKNILFGLQVIFLPGSIVQFYFLLSHPPPPPLHPLPNGRFLIQANISLFGLTFQGSKVYSQEPWQPQNV